MPHSDTDSDTSDDFSQLWPAIVTRVPAVIDDLMRLDASGSFRCVDTCRMHAMCKAMTGEGWSRRLKAKCAALAFI